jgi:hypothetical protein
MNRQPTRTYSFGFPMKRLSLLLGCGAAAVLFGFLLPVHTRGQANSGSQTGSPASSSSQPDNAPAPVKSGFVLFPINTNTWEVMDQSGIPLDGPVNEPEAMEDRYMANLALTDPEKYERLFPSTDAMKAASAAAIQAAEHPISLDARLKAITAPAELAQWKAAIYAISHPQPVTGAMATAV